MLRSAFAGFLLMMVGAALMGYCGNHLATKMGLEGSEVRYLIGYTLVPMLFLCPAFLALGRRLKGLEDKVQALEERVSGSDHHAP
ncbi:MAG TPA: hypothetical protein VF590_24745 [Isosphaeraceae bacterium]